MIATAQRETAELRVGIEAGTRLGLDLRTVKKR